MNAREAQALFIIKELISNFSLCIETADLYDFEENEMMSCIDKAQKFADKMEARYKRDAHGYIKPADSTGE